LAHWRRIWRWSSPILVLLAAGCERGGAPPSAPAGASSPTRGGTLQIIGSSDVDHLDTSSAYYSVTDIILRAFTRQLFSYPADTSFEVQSRPVPDLATAIPTRQNGGLSSDARTYTIHLRGGVKWDTDPPRDVTAADMVRGMKLLCNPVSPVGAPGYFEGTIEGMRTYCDAFAKVPGTVSAIRAFVQDHELPGVRAVDDTTVVLTLVQPAADFLHILAMRFASPVPVEYLDYLPDGPDFRRHTISDGPYRITHYDPNREIDLGRNPAWDSAMDPLRAAWVDSIQVIEGMDQQAVQQQLEAGTADMEWDQVPPTADLSSLLAAKDPNLLVGPPGDYYTNMLFLVINHLSPNDGGALGKLQVRQALEYAIDKAAVVQVTGGAAISRPLNQAAPEGAMGYRPGYDPYATPGSRGDPARARRLLTEAGYPGGVTLKLLYRTYGVDPQVAQTVQASLEKAGFHIQLVPSTGADFLARYLQNPGNAKRGVWDLASAAWIPDWWGNNGRAFLEPLFDGRTYGPNSSDYGGYNDPQTNALMDQAMAAASDSAAATAWQAVATHIMEDAALVPLAGQKSPIYHSARVRNCVFSLISANCDVTALWLKR
jgi:peptide/nickel transport system substrate-binding protein